MAVGQVASAAGTIVAAKSQAKSEKDARKHELEMARLNARGTAQFMRMKQKASRKAMPLYILGGLVLATVVVVVVMSRKKGRKS